MLSLILLDPARRIPAPPACFTVRPTLLDRWRSRHLWRDSFAAGTVTGLCPLARALLRVPGIHEAAVAEDVAEIVTTGGHCLSYTHDGGAFVRAFDLRGWLWARSRRVTFAQVDYEGEGL